MDIETLPILPSDYPLFDWSQFQSSYDALYEGGEVAAFKKEAWNAIVDSLVSVLVESGIGWDDKYTSIFGAKVTAAYGALFADQFNSVVHNIDNAAPLGWRWSFDRSFRGYLGRTVFKGDLKYGENADLFYPEYIKELVRRMNLLTEVLRGTAPLRDSGSKNRSYSDSLPYILQKPSFLITGQGKSLSETIGRLMKPKSSVALYAKSSFSDVVPFARSFKSAVIEPIEKPIKTKYTARARSPISSILDYKYLSHSLMKEPTLLAKRSSFAIYDELSKTLLSLDGFSVPRSSVSEIYEIIKSNINLTAVDLPSIAFSGVEIAKSSQVGEMNLPYSLLSSSFAKSKSTEESKIYDIDSFHIVSKNNHSYSDQRSIGDLIQTVRIEAECKINSKNNVRIDSAWYPPELVEDGVYFIRQVYDYNFDENTGVLEVI